MCTPQCSVCGAKVVKSIEFVCDDEQNGEPSTMMCGAQIDEAYINSTKDSDEKKDDINRFVHTKNILHTLQTRNSSIT